MLALLTLALSADAIAAPKPVTGKPCVKPKFEQVEQKQRFRAGKLGDMPPATQVLGVYNEVDGCPQPIVVRDSVGMPAK